jgi:molybdate transport system substrate-binding protein
MICSKQRRDGAFPFRFCAVWAAAALVIAPVPAARASEAPVIAAAASLRKALDEIAGAFEKETGRRVRVAYGATGSLVRQIEEGAPFELILAADEPGVARLSAAGRTEGMPSILVRGRLAVAAGKGSSVAVDESLEGLKGALAAGKVRHFAIANPDLAPYGRAAREVLQRAGLWEEIAPLLVVGENVARAAQFVSSAAAEAGLVALSLTVTPEFTAAATAAAVPEYWHKPITHGMALIKGAGETARAFQAYLKGGSARVIFERNGFAVP